MLRTLLSPPSASSSEAGTDVAQDMAVVLGVSDSDGGEDSGWSSDEDDLPLSSVPPPSHTLWMTFHNAILERSYVAWSARHMRAMDPAATLFSCVYLLALGWYPTFNLVATHPVMWGLGWVGLSPMLLCLLCPTYEWFLAQRERCIAAFHGVGLVWQTAVLNAAEPLEVVLLGQWSPVWRDPVVGALSWQVTNILMFQMRWKWMVAVACAVFMINTLPLLGPMCGVWGLDWAPHAPVSGFWGGEGDPHLGGATTADSLE